MKNVVRVSFTFPSGKRLMINFNSMRELDIWLACRWNWLTFRKMCLNGAYMCVDSYLVGKNKVLSIYCKMYRGNDLSAYYQQFAMPYVPFVSVLNHACEVLSNGKK